MLTRTFFTGFALLLLLLCPQQVAAQGQLISVSVVNRPYGELLELVARQSGREFSYNPKRIDNRQPVTYRAEATPLHQVLKEIAGLAGAEFELIENQIILRPARAVQKPDVRHTISGYVRDAGTGEALIGATVLIRELQAGGVANNYGFFSITIPPGSYEVVTSFVGYKDDVQPVVLNSDIQHDIRLAEEPPVLPELLISGTATELADDLHVMQTSAATVAPESVQQRPSFFGEPDVVKSLESVPGVKMHADGSTFYYVRGGHRDQNVIMIDDAPVYNPSHLLGVFSTVIPDAVQEMRLYRGEMPASLGGRISSFLDVRTKKGNDQSFDVWGGISLLSNKVGIEGPFRKDRSSYMLSTRFSRLKWLAQLANADVQKFQFYDITAKWNFRLGNEDRFFFTLYNGGDEYFNSNVGISWTNTAASFRWNHIVNEKLFLNSTVAAGNYDYFLHTDLRNGTRWNSHISNFNIRNDFSYFMNPRNELTYGFGFNGYNFNPGNLQSNVATIPVSLSVRNSLETVLYAHHETSFGTRWGASYGLRLTSWVNTGESFEFIFDHTHHVRDTLYFPSGSRYGRYRNLEPRISLRYELHPAVTLKAGFARNVQNVHLITNSVSPFTSLEVWLPSNLNIRPQVANMLTAGVYTQDLKRGIQYSAETYLKKMGNQIDYVSHAETLLNPLIESELRFGTGRAYGMELMAKKPQGRLRGHAGYTWSHSRRYIPELNGGQSFNAISDRPHQLSFMANYDVNLRWTVGMNWNYLTGAPFTSPTGFYNYNGLEVPVYGARNNDRLPDYHRLDVSASFRLNRNPENRFRHSLAFAVYNLYGRKNVLFFNYNKVVTGDGEFRVPVNLLEQQYNASQFYLFRFTPSISYEFKWL